MIGTLIGGGIRLVREQTRAVAIWGALFLVLGIAMYFAFKPMMAPMAEYQVQAAQARASGQLPPSFPGGFFLTLIPIYLVLILAVISVFAAAVRATAWGGTDSIGFLRFGMDEFRLLGLGVMWFFASLVGGIVLGIVIGIVGALVAVVSGGSTMTAGLLGFVLVIALFAASMWLYVRLSLIGAVTVLQGRMAISEGWAATRGRFWTLFGTYFVLWLGFMVMWLIVMAITQPQMLSAIVHGFDPATLEAANAAQMEQFSNGPSPMLIFGWIVAWVAGTLVYGVSFGTIATAALRFSETGQDHEAI
jgi:hypothetical protein